MNSRTLTANVCRIVGIVLAPLALSCAVAGQRSAAPVESQSQGGNPTVVPQQVRYAGLAIHRAGDRVEVVFRIYTAAEGGEPIWSETQKVSIGADGRYTVLLGAASMRGLPQTVFAGGEARWLGVSIERAPELPRTQLVSVPYAMKAGDAETLAGVPAGEFVRKGELASQLPVAARTPDAQPMTTPSGGGTANYVPLWTGTSSLGNSILYQQGTGVFARLGIGTATPATTLDVNGPIQVESTSILMGSAEFHSDVNLLPQTATASSPLNSSPWLLLGASSYNSSTSSGQFVNFGWQAVPTGGNTPSANLELLYEPSSVGSLPAPTGLSFGPTGLISFANGQTFPGTGKGTITGVTAGTGLTGGGTTGAVSLKIDSTKVVGGVIAGTGLTGGGTGGTPILSVDETTIPGMNTFNWFTGINEFSKPVYAFAGLNGFTRVSVGNSSSPTSSKPNANSGVLELDAAAYNSTTSGPQSLSFQWQAVASGGNTASPSANLQLLYSGGGSSLEKATGFSFGPTGLITFASGQTFPGTGPGTITGVTAGTGLTGGGTTGAVSLKIDPAKVVGGVIAGTGLTGGGTGGTPTLAVDATKVVGGVKAGAGLTGGGTGGTPTLAVDSTKVVGGVIAGTGLTGGGTGGMPTLSVNPALVVGGVKAGAGLTGGGTGGMPTLAVDTSKIPSLATHNIFTGGNTFEFGLTAQRSLLLGPAGLTSSTLPSLNSALLTLDANAYNSVTASPEDLKFAWLAVPTGGNTGSPSANLNLLYATGTAVPAPTGLSISPTGLITFVNGQTFPGAGGGGAITGVTAGAGLTGGGTSGNVTLAVNSSKVVTGVKAGVGLTGGGDGGTPTLSLDQSLVPVLNLANSFTASQNISTSQSGATTLNVEAYGPSSTGLWVSSTETGIIGSSSSDFSQGISGNSSGLYSIGVAGVSNGTGAGAAGVWGKGPYGVWGQSPGGIAVLGQLGSISTSYNTVTAAGHIAGIWADSGSPANAGNPTPGLIATADDMFAGQMFNNSTYSSTLFLRNFGAGGTLPTSRGGTGATTVLRAEGIGGVCSMSGGGDVACTGQLKALADTQGGTRKVETYAVQSAESWIEDFGTGRLENGRAVIQLDATFADASNTGMEYHVFITPKGEALPLYVTNETATSFEVRESSHGVSQIAFDYRIVAKRKGHETERLVDVTERFNREAAQRITPGAKPPVNSGPHLPVVRPLLPPRSNRGQKRGRS